MKDLSAGDKVRIIPGSKNYFKGEIESSLFEKEWTISHCDGSKTRISNGNVTLYIDISCLESISPETPSGSQMPSVTLASKEQVADNNSNDDAPGWSAIEKEFERVYPGQTDPKHYGTLIKWRLGGNDPLDGISVYEGRDYWHFVTFGSTELYEKETDDPEISGYGYELTFKLKKADYPDTEAEIRCVCGILQAVARITFKTGETFGPYEYIRTGQQTGIDANQRSSITGFICIPDPTVNSIMTPNGKVEFLELVGMTDNELKTLSNRDSVRSIYADLRSDITDYSRRSMI